MCPASHSIAADMADEYAAELPRPPDCSCDVTVMESEGWRAVSTG